MSIWNVLLIVIHVLILPTMTGITICYLFSLKKTIAACYGMGSLAEWALIQVVAVPLIILKCSFIYVVIPVFAGMLVLGCFGLYLFAKGKKRTIRINLSPSDWFSIVLLVVGYIILIYYMTTYTFKDYDDSRLVVSAVDIVKTNRMLLTNPSTGLPMDNLLGDYGRDAISPWMVYTAYISKMTGTQASITAHTILRHSLTLCMISTYWMIADSFFDRSVFSRCSFIFLAMLVNIYGTYSGYNTESFAITRIWQGKAVVASIGIPILFLILSWIYKNPDGWKLYILYYISIFALCLMSGMGIIICAIISGCTGIIYGILKKRGWITFKIWIAIIIPAGYYLVDYLVLNYTI